MSSTQVPLTEAAEKTLGSEATRIASEKAKAWLDQTLIVIRKKVLEMAEQGLFHCIIRFEDTVPQDPVNQERMLKVLSKENLKGEFKILEESVELFITWGHHLL